MSKVAVEYTCLYSTGDFSEGGEAFSGASIDKIDEHLETICGELGLRKILRWALKNPPACIMLHIQTCSEEAIKR